MRDDKWLFEKLDEVWDQYFGDVPQDNDVKIIWGRKARNRLGSIKQAAGNRQQATSTKHQASNKSQNHKSNQNSKLRTKKSNTHPVTIITINKLFQDEDIPEYVVLSTIAHEMTHYAHGFHSPLEQKFNTPHAGGIIHKEMEERGLAGLEKKAKKWLKENWRDYIMKNFPPKPRKRRRARIRWI